jgi:hypothetical protein
VKIFKFILKGGDPYAICDEPKNEGYTCGSGQPQSLYYYDGVTGFCEPLAYKVSFLLVNSIIIT